MSGPQDTHAIPADEWAFYGNPFPAHPSLTALPYEFDGPYPDGVHGVASLETYREVDGGPVLRDYTCYCGYVATAPTYQDAHAALVVHAEEEAAAVEIDGAEAEAELHDAHAIPAGDELPGAWADPAVRRGVAETIAALPTWDEYAAAEQARVRGAGNEEGTL
jgi:hypothetical protein